MAKLPGLGSDPGPIQEDLNGLMNAIARALDGMLNGPDCPADEKRIWFFLAAGNFGEGSDLPETNRFNYISNADKLDVRATLHDVLGRLEGRIAGEGRA